MFDRRQFFGGLAQAANGQPVQQMPPQAQPGVNWVTGSRGGFPGGPPQGGPPMLPGDRSQLEQAASQQGFSGPPAFARGGFDDDQRNGLAFGGAPGTPGGPGFGHPSFPSLRRHNPALDAAVASQHAAATSSNTTAVPVTTPATAQPVAPVAPPVAPVTAVPPVQAPVVSPEVPAPVAPVAAAPAPPAPIGRPRADGAPGDAPGDWVNSGGYYYPTSIAPWLAQYQHQLASAQAPIATVAPVAPVTPAPSAIATAPAPAVAPVQPAVAPAPMAPLAPTAAPASPPAASTPPVPAPIAPPAPAAAPFMPYANFGGTITGAMIPRNLGGSMGVDFGGFDQQGNPRDTAGNFMQPPPGVDRGSWISSMTTEQTRNANPNGFDAAQQSRGQEIGAYQVARDAALGQMLPGSVGANGVDYGKAQADPSAAGRAFAASGYTPQQALNDGWGTRVGTPGWTGGPTTTSSAPQTPPSTSYLPPAPTPPSSTPRPPVTPDATNNPAHPKATPPPDSNKPPATAPGSQFRPVHSWMAPGLKPAGY